MFVQRSDYSESERLANIAALEGMLNVEAERSDRMARGASAMVRSFATLTHKSFELASDMPSWTTDSAS